LSEEYDVDQRQLRGNLAFVRVLIWSPRCACRPWKDELDLTDDA
jgi:hypothetical protein